MKKIKIFTRDLIHVSRLTKTKNKKIRIFTVGLISNLIVLMDVLIILSFTYVFTDKVSIKNNITDLLFDNLGILPFLIVVRFLSIYYEKINIAKLRLEIEESLRDELVNEVFNKGNFSSSDAYFYINTIAGQVSNFYSTLAVFIGSALQVIAYTSYLIFTDLRTISILSVGIVILYFPTIYIVKLGRKMSHKTYISSQEISSDIEKIVDNIYLIKILNLTHRELENFRQNLKNYYGSTLTNLRLGTMNAIIPNFITFFGLGVLVVFFDIVRFITLDFIGVALRLFQALGVLNSNLHLVSAYHIYLEKLFQLEKDKSSVNKDNFVINQNMDSEIAIQFKNVNFKYFNSDEQIFNNLDLSIMKNKHTVITGPNGSGKSTLLGLLSGIFYPTDGKINVYTDKFGYVGASPMIINATLRENLNYGNEKIKDDNELLNMIEKFKVFNEDKQNSLDLKVSNKSLSTGQMQKVSFIRALLNDVNILLLDESLSNVDKNTKDSILSVVEEMDITIINITHNLEDFSSYDSHLKLIINNEKRSVVFV